MSSALDMSLDDLIKNNKKPNPSRSNSRSAAGPGPTRRFNNRSANRSNPYSVSKAPESTWKHDMYSEPAAFTSFGGGSAGGRSIETGTKLYISNLDYGVSNEDIKELFSEAGDVKRYSVHFDRSGRSKGTAEVIFSRKQDALAAVKRYNNVQLDGKPMKIEIVGTNIPAAPAPQASQAFNGGFSNSNGAPRSFPARSRYNGPSRGGGGRGRGRGGGRGRGRDRAEPVSATDLDADLDKYHSESMQT